MEPKIDSIYNTGLITRRITMNFNQVSNNLIHKLQSIISDKYEGKCSPEGFIKPDSCSVINYSSGLLVEDKILFDVVVKCLICLPVEGTVIQCSVKNITKAGIRAIYKNS